MNADDFKTNAVFLGACAELIGSMSDSARPRHSAPGDATSEFAQNVEYYKHHLKSLWDRLLALSTDNAYKKPVSGLPAHLRTLVAAGGAPQYSIVAPAITADTARRLLAVPAMQFDFIAKHYHDVVQTPPARLQWNPGAPTMTFAHYGLEQVRANFDANITEICARVTANWSDLNRFFFQRRPGIPDECLVQLLKVSSSGSDPHKGGKQTYMMTFSAGPMAPPRVRRPGVVLPGRGVITAPVVGGPGHVAAINFLNWPRRRLIYKCADMELDTRLLGDTQALTGGGLTANLPNLAQGSLVEVLNGIQPGLNLPVYRILPINAGSLNGVALSNDRGSNAASDGNIPLQNSYGYLQFLDHEPDLTARPLPVDGALDASDTLTRQSADADLFLKHYAWYLAMANLTGMCDAHRENAIVHRKKLHLIDAEISFKKANPTVGETMLDQSLGGELSIGDHHCLLFLKTLTGFVHAALGVSADHARQLIRAELLAAFTAISNNAAAVRNWLTDPNLALTVARITLQATKDFGLTRHNFWSTVANVPISDPGPPLAANLPASAGVFPGGVGALRERAPFFWRSKLKNWRLGSGDVKFYIQPIWATQTYSNDYTCLLNCDYPCHYFRLGSLDVLNARGEPIRVINPPPTLLAAGDNTADPNNRLPLGPRYFQAWPRLERFELEQAAAPTDVQLNGPGAIALLQPYFNSVGYPLGANAQIQALPGGNAWSITETPNPADAEHEWRLIRRPDSNLDVRLIRTSNADADLGVVATAVGANQLSQGGIFVTGLTKVTVARLDTKTTSNMKDVVKRAGFTLYSKFIGSGSTGTVVHLGQSWKLREIKNQSLAFLAYPQGATPGAYYIKPIRDGIDLGDRTAMPYFTIPRTLTTNELDAATANGFATRQGTAVIDIFASHGINLSAHAQFVQGLQGKLWQIRDGNRAFQIRGTSVTEVGTAIDGAVEHFNYVVNNPQAQANAMAIDAEKINEDHLTQLGATVST